MAKQSKSEPKKEVSQQQAPPVPTVTKSSWKNDPFYKFFAVILVSSAVVFAYSMFFVTFPLGDDTLPAKITGVVDGYTFKAYLPMQKQEYTVKLSKITGTPTMNEQAKLYAEANLVGKNVCLMMDSRVGYIDSDGAIIANVLTKWNGSLTTATDYGSGLILMGAAQPDLSGNYSLKQDYESVESDTIYFNHYECI